VGLQEPVERTQRRQPPIYGSDGVALRLAVGDVIIHIADGDDYGRLVGSDKEVVEITGVVTGGAGVGTFAPQPTGEFLDFRIQFVTSW
jgi:hypothetical protein